jgi:hypothetical protein
LLFEFEPDTPSIPDGYMAGEFYSEMVARAHEGYLSEEAKLRAQGLHASLDNLSAVGRIRFDRLACWRGGALCGRDDHGASDHGASKVVLGGVTRDLISA